jgi:hypothetical protein
MLKTGIIVKRLYQRFEPAAQNLCIADLRIGVSYAGIKLDNGAAGIAAILPEGSVRGCTVLKEAGTYAGSPAVETLQYLVDGKDTLHRAVGLATANALIAPGIGNTEDREATTFLDLKPGEKVTMVGLFAPLVERIRATGAALTIVEKNPERLELLSPEDKQKALKDCNVAMITATTLLNNTFEETIDLLGAPRSVVLMGPSTPLVPEIFHDTPVTHLGGAVVTDAAKALQIISEGGGTPALRRYLRFVNFILSGE